MKDRLLTFGHLQWMTSVAMVVLCALIVVTFLGLRDNARDLERASCDGALDTRRVIVELLEFTGENQIDPGDYTGEVRDVIVQSQRRAQEFRDAQIAALERPPPQCALLQEPPSDPASSLAS